MEKFGINVFVDKRGVSRFRRDGEERWDLAEAEELAFASFEAGRYAWVSLGNSDEHEMRMWGPDVTDFGNFNHDGHRWARYYVDVEINGRRWRYRPLADLNDFESADELGELAATLHPTVTRIWTGASDGSMELEQDTRER